MKEASNTLYIIYSLSYYQDPSICVEMTQIRVAFYRRYGVSPTATQRRIVFPGYDVCDAYHISEQTFFSDIVSGLYASRYIYGSD